MFLRRELLGCPAYSENSYFWGERTIPRVSLRNELGIDRKEKEVARAPEGQVWPGCAKGLDAGPVLGAMRPGQQGPAWALAHPTEVFRFEPPLQEGAESWRIPDPADCLWASGISTARAHLQPL